jgi:hypothetical protein
MLAQARACTLTAVSNTVYVHSHIILSGCQLQVTQLRLATVAACMLHTYAVSRSLQLCTSLVLDLCTVGLFFQVLNALWPLPRPLLFRVG